MKNIKIKLYKAISKKIKNILSEFDAKNITEANNYLIKLLGKTLYLNFTIKEIV